MSGVSGVIPILPLIGLSNPIIPTLINLLSFTLALYNRYLYALGLKGERIRVSVEYILYGEFPYM